MLTSSFRNVFISSSPPASSRASPAGMKEANRCKCLPLIIWKFWRVRDMLKGLWFLIFSHWEENYFHFTRSENVSKDYVVISNIENTFSLTSGKNVCDSFDTVGEFSVVPGVLKLHRHTKSVAHSQTHNWFTHRKHLFETQVVWTQIQLKKTTLFQEEGIKGSRN